MFCSLLQILNFSFFSSWKILKSNDYKIHKQRRVCLSANWILLQPVLGVWMVACTFHYRPWTGSIKPSLKLSLQHLQFCCFWLSLGVPVFCILMCISLVKLLKLINKIIKRGCISSVLEIKDVFVLFRASGGHIMTVD